MFVRNLKKVAKCFEQHYDEMLYCSSKSSQYNCYTDQACCEQEKQRKMLNQLHGESLFIYMYMNNNNKKKPWIGPSVEQPLWGSSKEGLQYTVQPV